MFTRHEIIIFESIVDQIDIVEETEYRLNKSRLQCKCSIALLLSVRHYLKGQLGPTISGLCMLQCLLDTMLGLRLSLWAMLVHHQTSIWSTSRICRLIIIYQCS